MSEEYKKKYYEENKKKYVELYKENKKKILENNKIICVCDICQCEYQKGNKTNHKRTQQHKNNVAIYGNLDYCTKLKERLGKKGKMAWNKIFFKYISEDKLDTDILSIYLESFIKENKDKLENVDYEDINTIFEILRGMMLYKLTLKEKLIKL